jgi:hypothetical protein
MMKRILFLIGLCLCASVQAAVAPEFLLQNYHAGPVAVGMSAEDAMKQYPAERVKRWEPYKAFEVIDIFASADQNAEPALRLSLDRRTHAVQSIGVQDKRYQTSQGITVESTFGELKKAHPKLSIRLESGEMDYYLVAEIESQGIICVLSYDEAAWKALKRKADSQNVPAQLIPDATPIRTLSLYRSRL